MTKPTMQSLQGQFLVAMPNLADSFFERKLVYLIEHDDKGAMGLVINHALDVRVDEILEQFGGQDQQSHHPRSEEHTSELQSRPHLVCRLLLEKKKKKRYPA